MILSLTAVALPVVGLCELGNCPQTTACGVLRGSARPTTAACINLGTFYGVGLPVAVFLGFKMGKGLVGLWVGLLAAQMVCAAVMVVVLVTTDWNVQAERAKKLTRVNLENSQGSHDNDDETSTSDENIDDQDEEAGLVSVVLEN